MTTINSLDGIKVAYRAMNKEIPNLWVKHGYEKVTLHKGWVKDAGRRPLPMDMVFEKDCSITLRDGVKIYADVFRPIDADTKPVPAILCWSIYGKSGVGVCRHTRHINHHLAATC
jgi:predicted acyl esterase